MKIIISSTGKKWGDLIDPHFEEAKGFVLLNEETNKKSWHSNEDFLDTKSNHEIQAAQYVINSGASVLITGSVGKFALYMLNRYNIKIYKASKISLLDGWIDYRRGILSELVP